MARHSPTESEIYDRIRDAISARALLPAQRLREVELCRIFDASRGNVRKALDRLAFDGLVDRQLNRGASVAKPSAKDAADLFAARKCIETAIAHEAATRLEQRDIDRLRIHIARERKARQEGKHERIISLSGEFHILLADIADNKVLKRYLSDIIARESLIILLFERSDNQCCSHDEHAEILEALIDGNRDLIGKKIELHINSIEKGLDLEEKPAVEHNLEDILYRKL